MQLHICTVSTHQIAPKTQRWHGVLIVRHISCSCFGSRPFFGCKARKRHEPALISRPSSASQKLIEASNAFAKERKSITFWQGSNVLRLNLLNLSKTAFLLMSKLFFLFLSLLCNDSIYCNGLFRLFTSKNVVLMVLGFVWQCVRPSHMRQLKFSHNITAFNALTAYPIVHTNLCPLWCEKSSFSDHNTTTLLKKVDLCWVN